MRIAIFWGLLSIADAIRKDWAGEYTVAVVAFASIAFVIMDITEFFKKLRS